MGRDFCLNTGLHHWSLQEAKNDATKKGVDRAGKNESRETKGSPRCRRETKWQFKWEWKAGVSGMVPHRKPVLERLREGRGPSEFGAVELVR